MSPEQSAQTVVRGSAPKPELCLAELLAFLLFSLTSGTRYPTHGQEEGE